MATNKCDNNGNIDGSADEILDKKISTSAIRDNVRNCKLGYDIGYSDIRYSVHGIRYSSIRPNAMIYGCTQ